jgi:hypothetical protein
VQGLQLPGKPSSFVYPFCEACACAKSVRTPASATPGSVHRRKPTPKAMSNTISSTSSKSDVTTTNDYDYPDLISDSDDEEDSTDCQQLSRRRLNSPQPGEAIYKEHSNRYRCENIEESLLCS